MRARALIAGVAIFAASCAGHDIDAVRCGAAVFEAAQAVADACLHEVDDYCPVNYELDDGHNEP